ncbi:MAG: SPOR domain-containing protein [Spirochaetaceae bacterium]|jgi:DedD protein|nr:SPOR domain-containing protein [Spirochaetaceae bacterium]
MDKKKLLIMVICIGFFLVIIIGGSILIFSPRAVPAVSPVSSTPQTNTSSDTTPDSGVASITPTTHTTAEQAAAATNFDPPPFTGYTEDSVNTPAQEQGESATVVTVPRPSTAGVPNTTSSENTTPRSTTRPAASTPATSTPKAAPTPASAAKPAPQTVTTSPPQASKTAPANSYWIQTGSFSTLTRAESAKELLMTKGFSSIIESSDVHGEMFYRVRVGPYTSKNEAEYWLPIVKAIEGFESSLVWQTQSQQS